MEQFYIIGTLTLAVGVALWFFIERTHSNHVGEELEMTRPIGRPPWYYLGTGVAISLIISGVFIFYLISRNQIENISMFVGGAFVLGMGIFSVGGLGLEKYALTRNTGQIPSADNSDSSGIQPESSGFNKQMAAPRLARIAIWTFAAYSVLVYWDGRMDIQELTVRLIVAAIISFGVSKWLDLRRESEE